jgi:hypothetical protein
MLVFVDESGDLGFKIERGSTRFFTIALVIFEDAEAARSCQRAVERLQAALKLPQQYEFHFHDDSHQRRLAFLGAVKNHRFICHTFTLDKASERLTGPGFKYRGPAYKTVCRMALENAAADMKNATVIIDGSGDRTFRREMGTYLRRELNKKQQKQVGAVKIGRSRGDPLLQLADYVAGITNRFFERKAGAEIYDGYLRLKMLSRRKWP